MAATTPPPATSSRTKASPAIEVPYPDLIRRFIRQSAAFAGIPANLPADPDIAATFPHLWFGPLNCRQWFAFQLLHDSDHLRSIGHLRQAESFPAD